VAVVRCALVLLSLYVVVGVCAGGDADNFVGIIDGVFFDDGTWRSGLPWASMHRRPSFFSLQADDVKDSGNGGVVYVFIDPARRVEVALRVWNKGECGAIQRVRRPNRAPHRGMILLWRAGGNVPNNLWRANVSSVSKRLPNVV
jgi:hypothetical protein